MTLTAGPTPTTSPLELGGADKIAFLNENEIWIANLDGSARVKLTDDKIPKQYLQWTPDGNALTYWIPDKNTYMMLQPGSDKPQEIGAFEDFEISPDQSQIVVGKTVMYPNETLDWLNFITPYSNGANLNRMADIPRSETKDGCPFKGGRQTRFSADGKLMAGIFDGNENGRKVELIQVFSLDEHCIMDLVDEFPSKRFPMKGYSSTDETPVILDYGWDGDKLFALHGNVLNGMGELVIYNRDTAISKVLNPIEGKCCYQDIQFSPDGQYLLFVFKDIIPEMSDKKIYYIPYGTTGTGATFQPMDLPYYFFRDTTKNVEPALRPAP
jgi:hypothetical protein